LQKYIANSILFSDQILRYSKKYLAHIRDCILTKLKKNSKELHSLQRSTVNVLIDFQTRLLPNDWEFQRILNAKLKKIKIFIVLNGKSILVNVPPKYLFSSPKYHNYGQKFCAFTRNYSIISFRIYAYYEHLNKNGR
jgi:hypothetical protein